MTKNIKIPWAAWREPDYLDLTFPDSWDVSVCEMNGGPVLTSDEIKKGIKTPIGTPSLSELAIGKKNAVIVVDDMTRVTPVSKIMPHVLEILFNSGMEQEQITILMATGAHRPLLREDMILKLGKKVVDTINIENHHPYINLTYKGKSNIGTPIYVNTTYDKADLKISLGGVIPHPQAGFGGGAKIVLPGVCGLETLYANHSAPEKLGISEGVGEINDLRRNIEEIAGIVGLDYSINIVLTDIGDIAGVYSGHFIDAHRKTLEKCKQVYGTKIPQLENDVCILNAFPEDSELNQAGKAFNFFRMAPNNLMNSEGHIVVMSSSHEGKGYHSLYSETGALLYNDPKTRPKADRRIFFFSQNIREFDLYHFYTKNWELYGNWDELVEELDKLHKNPNVVIVPTSIQIPE